MGKETDLWDDSALIRAFDNAISKYKKMHSDKYQVDPSEDEKVTSSDNGMEPDPADDTGTTKLEDNNSNRSKNATQTYLHCDDVEESNELPSIQENYVGDETSAYVRSSSVLPVQETFEGFPGTQGEEYKKLLGQYYEIENQRQRVLQQLHQASGWNYQSLSECSGSCLPCYMCYSASQPNEVPLHSTSYPVYLSSCYPYSCHCLAAPALPSPACALDGQYIPISPTSTTATATSCRTDQVKVAPSTDDIVVKTAMVAAEQAIASVKVNASATSDIHQEVKEKTQNSNALEGGVAQNVSSEADLAVVLNAWYSAGFYTAKYLMEQSLAKGQR